MLARLGVRTRHSDFHDLFYASSERAARTDHCILWPELVNYTDLAIGILLGACLPKSWGDDSCRLDLPTVLRVMRHGMKFCRLEAVVSQDCVGTTA